MRPVQQFCLMLSSLQIGKAALFLGFMLSGREQLKLEQLVTARAYAAMYLVLEDVLREQSASSDANVAARAGLELGSGAALRRVALDGVHAVLLTLALAVRPVLPVHRQGVRVVDDQRCLDA